VATQQELSDLKLAYEQAKSEFKAADAAARKFSAANGGSFKVGTPAYEEKLRLDRIADDAVTKVNLAQSAIYEAQQPAKEPVQQPTQEPAQTYPAARQNAQDVQTGIQENAANNTTGGGTVFGISPVTAPQALGPDSTGSAYGTGDSTALGISPVYAPQALGPDSTGNTSAALTTSQVKPASTDSSPTAPQPIAVRTPKSVNDWRVKLSLAPQSNYLYNQADPGILAPLKDTGGVIFPYTPQVSTSYSASYDQTDLTHSNYRIYQYRGSNVGEISILADFTAQDTVEANYLLAVIHFFKSATKMFYGQDKEPKPGTPPPLCYLSGYGLYQFNNCPLVIQTFGYTLPNDVDYIRAGNSKMTTGSNFSLTAKNNQPAKQTTNSVWSKLVRMSNSGVKPGAMREPPKFGDSNVSANENTYVPTKMSIQLTCLPIVTRKDISNNFSLSEYSKGKLWGIW